MWIMNFYLFIGLAIFFLLVSLWKETNEYWNILSAFMSSVLWLIIGFGQLEIDIPYTAINSADAIVTGSWTYTDPLSPFFIWVYFGLFAILQIYCWIMVMDWLDSRLSDNLKMD